MDRPNPIMKAEPELSIKESNATTKAEVTWKQQIKVLDSANRVRRRRSGTVRMQVCDAKGCLPPEDIPFAVELTISDAPPVEASAPSSASAEPVKPATRPDSGLLGFILAGIFWGGCRSSRRASSR